MAWSLVSIKPLSEIMLPYCLLNPKEHISVRVLKNSRKCTWKCHVQIDGNLSQPQCVNNWKHMKVYLGVGQHWDIGCLGVNSLWPSDTIWWQGSGSTLVQVMALLPDGTKPLPEPMVTYYQKGPAMFIWGQLCLRCYSHQSLKLAWFFLKILLKSPRSQWVNAPGHQHPLYWFSVYCMKFFFMWSS